MNFWRLLMWLLGGALIAVLVVLALAEMNPAPPQVSAPSSNDDAAFGKMK